MASLDAGTMVGSLRIERELGRGGFARVYLADDTRLGRQVALKVFSREGLGDRALVDVDKFLGEARVIARLESPHVVTLFQLHEAPDAALMLEMEYVRGGTLDDLLRGGSLSLEQAEAVMGGILRGLGTAHAGGVLHRDIKPANILITEDGAAKLSDFGLAQVIGEEMDFDGAMHGTPVYMAPELLVGESPSAQSDLWSVGVVAYQLLSGNRPFPAGDPATFFAAVHNEDPAPLPPLVPPQLRSLVARCLEKQPGARPSSCRDALDLLADKSIRVVQPAPRATPATNFHGRETELAHIEETLRPGGPGTLVLTGPAGVGKSALCQAAAQRARDYMWIDVALSTVEGPLTTLVEAARATTLDGEDPATSGFGPGGSSVKGILRGDDLPVLQSPEQALWTLRSLLLGVASTRPLVLCVDDAQHASEEDIELLEGLARQLADRPFTLLVVSRPESPASAGFAGAARLDLGGLKPEPLFALLEDRLEAGLAGRIAEHIWQRTDGNPLQAVELARHLEEAGSLVRRGGRLEAGETWSAQSVPTRMRDIVHARLATLDDVERSLLEVAAVDGLEFDGRALAATLGLPMLQVLRKLQTICRSRALIAPSPKGYRFADLPTQEVLYEDMAPELLTELHRTLAEHLEQREDEIDGARLGRHWERCGNRPRAAPYLFEVAQKARDRQEIRRYIDFAKRAGLLEDPPLVDLRARADLVIHLATTLMRRGDQEAAEALYARLAQSADEDGDERLRERIAVRRASAVLLAGKRPDGDLDRWRCAAERLGETEDGGIALSIVGHLAKLDGNFETASAAFEQADQIFCSNNLAVLHATMQGQLGAVALRAGRMEDARALFSCAAEIAEQNGLANNAAVSRTNAALAGMQVGDMDGVEPDLRRSIRTFDLAGWFGIAAQARLYLAEVLFAHGDTRGALEAVESALPDLERADHQVALANAIRLRAEFLAVGDRLDEAADAIARALEYAQSGGDRSQLIVAQAVNALIATAQERDEDAAHAIAAIRDANPDGNAAADGAVLILCEAVHIGLPTAELESVGSLARTNHERLLREATLGFLNGFAFGPALQDLERCKIGLRRASYRLLIDWLAAQQAIRSGDEPEAKKRTTAALKTAATLGHVRAEAMLRF